MKKKFIRCSLFITTPILLTGCGVPLFNFSFLDSKNAEIMQIGDYLTWDILENSNAYIVEADKNYNDGSSEHFTSSLKRDNFIQYKTDEYNLDNLVIKYYLAEEANDGSASLIKESEPFKINTKQTKKNMKTISHGDFAKRDESSSNVYKYVIRNDVGTINFSRNVYNAYSFSIMGRREDLHVYLSYTEIYSFYDANGKNDAAPVFAYKGTSSFNCFFHLTGNSTLYAGLECPVFSNMKNVVFVNEVDGGLTAKAGSAKSAKNNRTSKINSGSKFAIESDFILNTVDKASSDNGKVILIGGKGSDADGEECDGAMGNYPFSGETRIAGKYNSLGILAGDGGMSSESTIWNKYYGGNAMSFEYMIANDLNKYKDYFISGGIPTPGPGKEASGAVSFDGKPGEVLYP